MITNKSFSKSKKNIYITCCELRHMKCCATCFTMSGTIRPSLIIIFNGACLNGCVDTIHGAHSQNNMIISQICQIFQYKMERTNSWRVCAQITVLEIKQVSNKYKLQKSSQT